MKSADKPLKWRRGSHSSYARPGIASLNWRTMLQPTAIVPSGLNRGSTRSAREIEQAVSDRKAYRSQRLNVTIVGFVSGTKLEARAAHFHRRHYHSSGGDRRPLRSESQPLT